MLKTRTNPSESSESESSESNFAVIRNCIMLNIYLEKTK